MSNEIKQGDKVRVSSRVPRIYERFGSMIAPHYECKVVEIDDGMALLDSIPVKHVFLFPLKYLVKVDAEAKEPKFKVNDVVRTVFNETTHITSVLENGNYYLYGMGNEYPEDSLTLIRPYTEPTAPTIKAGDRVRNIESGLIGVVDKIVYENIAWVNGVDGRRYHWKLDELELVKPTEQTEAKEDARIRQMEIELDEFRKAELDRILHPEKYYTYEVTVDNMAMNWQRYEADLAKEVALKITNKHMDGKPEDVGAYAVSVAKAVVEGLKSK